MSSWPRTWSACLLWCVLGAWSVVPTTQGTFTVREALAGDADPGAPEISTEELEKVLASGSATVFDARPYEEFAISHIPGAINVAPKAGVSMSMYVSDVAEIGRVVKGQKAAPIVLYCNGLHCGKSKRLSAELVEAGYTNVRRYQLGLPVWRAVGGLAESELAGVVYAVTKDRTTVVVDAREAAEFAAGSVPGAVNIPRSLVVDAKDMGEVRKAKDDGRLPMNDHQTRIIVLAATPEAARFVARRVAFEAFTGVTYFSGSVDRVIKALR